MASVSSKVRVEFSIALELKTCSGMPARVISRTAAGLFLARAW